MQRCEGWLFGRIPGCLPGWGSEAPTKAVAFIRKDMVIAMSYRLQFLSQLSQIVIGVAVIYFLGRMISIAGGSALLEDYHADYFAFAVVGLAVTSYLKAGLVTVTNDIRQLMNQGTLEAMCATPVGYTALLVYNALWAFLFETLRVICYFLVGMLVFGLRFPHANWVGAGLTLMLTVPIFLLFGIISCSVLVLVKRGDPVNWIFSSASSLLAGTMFPIAVLPVWLRVVAMCLPLTHALEALRRFLLAGARIGAVSDHLAVMGLFIIVLMPITIVINTVCMRAAKKKGAFSTH